MLLPPLSTGRYIVAVSGGVDSMVLLDTLSRKAGLELIVAHFDHGIRDDSAKDAQFVAKVAASMGLQCVTGHTELGMGVSEAVARKARYAFLHRAKMQYDAQAIITAHHRDDMLETAIINIVRGTGWRGIASLRSVKDTLRPMLDIPKSDILAYARVHGLDWREDSTNTDTRYLRNDIRLRLLPRIAARDASAAERFLQLSRAQLQLRDEFDEQMQLLMHTLTKDERGGLRFKRADLARLPLVVCLEVLRAMAVRISGNALERPVLRRMRVFACTARPGKRMEITKNLTMRVLGDSVIVYNR